MADCVSCGITLAHVDYVSFDCPVCGEVTISRCARCRQQGNRYVCESCGFEGP